MRLQPRRLLAVDARRHALISHDKVEPSPRAKTFLDCSYRSGASTDTGHIEIGLIDRRCIRLLASET
jgi:hypothetical protein